MQIQHDEQTQILNDAQSIVAAALRAGLARKPVGGLTGGEFQRRKTYLARQERKTLEETRYRAELEAANQQRNEQRQPDLS